MNVRNHRVLWVGGGACSVWLGAALFLLVRASAPYQQQSKEIHRRYRRLSELNARNPFPARENLKQMERNLERLESYVGALEVQLRRDPFPNALVDAAGFSARAQGVIERFRKRADDAGIRLPDRLEAGFAKYASAGAIPAEEHVPRLSRQLYSVERVADVLVRGGVLSIETLTRDLFEAPASPARQTSDRRRRARREVADPPPKKGLRSGVAGVQPERLYYIERVGTTFTATEQSVWQVLDLLASAPHFMAVTDFTHTTQTDILSYNPDAAVRRGPGDAEVLEFRSSGILSGSKALSRLERLVAGEETIQVSLRVDVYNFEPAREEPLP